jgi:hypothetical protein
VEAGFVWLGFALVGLDAGVLCVGTGVGVGVGVDAGGALFWVFCVATLAELVELAEFD